MHNNDDDHEHDAIHDEGRIEVIARLKLHEDQVDDILNTYAQKASEEFNLPISMVSVVLDEAQIAAGAHGLEGWIAEAGGIPVEWSFCSNSVESRQPFVVGNLENNEKTNTNPLVKMDGIKCYAGAPMITSNGFVIGNFCVVGVEERTFTNDEIAKLKVYAKQAVDHIEQRVA